MTFTSVLLIAHLKEIKRFSLLVLRIHVCVIPWHQGMFICLRAFLNFRLFLPGR